MIDPATASAVIDWSAYRHNLTVLADHVAPATLMAVVKADGYGHGMVEAARQARAAGVTWLGVAVAGEALTLRAQGDRGRLMCWLYGPQEDFTGLVGAEVDLSVSSLAELDRIAAAARSLGRKARVHLKVDSGLSRNGCPVEQWPELCRAAAARTGEVEVVAVWTHLAAAEEPDHPSVPAQLTTFDQAFALAREHGLSPIRHVANSAAAMILPQARYELVRVGIAGYGIDPGVGVADRAGIALAPVMTLRAALVNVKRIPAGAGVSYGHTWIAPRDTVVGLVPLGYADGIVRAAGNRASVVVNDREVPLVGRVCMDQCVVDLGPDSRDRVGDPVVMFGQQGRAVNDFAADCDTIGYEIVTRIGSRVPRVAQVAGSVEVSRDE
ncbi:MAG TPA: alanine racemase [Candidatus Avipropionibacterium avicola]|uniref:Alanine racemase n=1 Tax=Candidatus Avipropionibacterium avicola TaxID=2840701 RepID=A0A9D1GYK9_9ACTN|nr:alanine racemase [Candidatus Avipropionibacterium avicola]